jgi:hypothetical protein
MIRYRFKEEEGNFGSVLRPVAEVILENKGLRIVIPMYIDSGADISLIPFKYGKILGFKQEEGDDIQEIKGVSGVSVPYILKRIILVLNGKKFKIRIAWSLIEEIPALMGRIDVFDKFRIIFDERKGWIEFEE